MNCETFRDQAFDFLQGSLPAGGGFEAHRASCAGCAASLAGIRENERLLSAARVPLAPPDLWPRIAAAIGESRPIPFRLLRAASAIAAAAARFLVVLLVSSSSAPRKTPKIDLVVHEVGPESQRAFRTLVPRYEDVDAATAMVDTMFRTDY
jgi:hypothetical protein